ncbi:BTB/POZ domain-containing protein [Apostasia shenzhenica]|uniref:BTB/POZ domain-containing protein n=1 Tax=Apostasia shenzhenica TaxID=1088818 RepID=A0A2I0BED7_9ASPA|nr:BTB/POZ domain-containing protein [Apostasia shenzhenica]
MDRGAFAVCVPTNQQRPDRWMLLDVPSDVTIDVNGASFSLHKFPLVSRSGRIRKLMAGYKDSGISRIELLNLPGGAEAFELAAKFCYGVNFEITTNNVAQLFCASMYLEMTEEYASENLAPRSEVYLNEIVCKSLEMSVEVLHQCENLLPFADELNIVGRCIEAIVSKACAEQIASSFSRLEYSSSGRLHLSKQAKSKGDWWIEDLSILRVDLYQRVIESMKCRGVRPESIGLSLVQFTEKNLRRKPDIWNLTSHPGIDLVESITSLLPVEKLAVPISFLFGLLRSAIMLDCTMSCRINLERRIGSQLEMASLDDLLIPCQNAGDTIFDVDTVHRILVVFSQQDESEDGSSGYDSDCLNPPSQTALVKVSKLVDNYLAEIAPDANLKLAKFIVIADTLPGYARTSDDGLYRAIDIYLKAHQGLSDLERRRLCKLIDFQKLSEEACSHAAQNERLPLQATVQVLYNEQLRLRSSLGCSNDENVNANTLHLPRRIGGCAHSTAAAASPPDNYASLRRENRELKLELARIRIRLKDLEIGHACIKEDMEKSNSQKLMCSISRKIRRLNLFKASNPPSKKSQRSDNSLA